MKKALIFSAFSCLISSSGDALECPSVESINFVMKQSLKEIVENSLQKHGVKLGEEYFRLPPNTIMKSDPVEFMPPYEKAVVTCSYFLEDKDLHRKNLLLQFTLHTDIEGIKDNKDNKEGK
jgi:hypothetical protein